MPLNFANPVTGQPLVEKNGALVDENTLEQVAPIVNSIPRFVEDHYADSFSWQWKQWEDTLSDARNTGTAKRDVIMERTHFEEYEMKDKTILECGMGGGDDTEILLNLPFSEIHSFDLSESVDRASKFLSDPRLVISQASIYEIPYPDKVFDFVFCHRVLQHTPDPVRALRCVCKKVKPGGVLFAHSYKKSWIYLMHYKYKYRWLTKRLSHERVYNFVERYGSGLHAINERFWKRNSLLKALAFNFVPFDWVGEYGELDRGKLIDLEKLNTFDALTPEHDHPMSTGTFRGVIEDEGFHIEHFYDPQITPLYCTAVKLA